MAPFSGTFFCRGPAESHGTFFLGQILRQYLYEGFAWFVAAYRTAAEKLQRGDPDPHFPIGSFPPALPFVGG
jgi:hypothetical protein